MNQTEQQPDYKKILEPESQQMATHRQQKKKKNQNRIHDKGVPGF